MLLSHVHSGNDVGRFDSSYFLKSDLERLKRITALSPSRLGDLCYVTDGIHTSIEFESGSGIKVISAQHPKNGILDLSSFEEISTISHLENPRTALRTNDIVISTVGTIGNAAVVRKEVLPANSDRHIGIMRPLPRDKPISPEFLSAFLNSAYGRMQSRRETTGNVQPNLFLEKIRDLKVIRFSDQFELRVNDLSLLSLDAHMASERAMAEAEFALLSALGGTDWTPTEPLTYSARASDAFAALRLDAQYFMPAKEQVRRSLAALRGKPLSDRAESIREQWLPDNAPPGMLVRNYDVTDALVPILDAEKEPTAAADIGSMKKVLRDGDVAISRLRAYLKETAVVRTADEIPSVGSSEFIVLRPKGLIISPETLMVFLRSAPVQTILKWCQDGSQHPRFSESDLLAIPVPDAVAQVSPKVTATVQQGFAARRRARHLLDAAKRAVEIAIEAGGPEAIAFLAQAEQAAMPLVSL